MFVVPFFRYSVRLGSSTRRFNDSAYGDFATAKIASIAFHESASKLVAGFAMRKGQARE